MKIKILNRQVRKALEDIWEKPSKIIKLQLLTHYVDKYAITTLYDLQLFRKNMHYAQSSILLKSPTNFKFQIWRNYILILH